MTHLTGSYNGWLVFLSVAVAAVASYSALQLASRVIQSSGCKEKSMVDHWCDDHGDGNMVNAFYWHDGVSSTLWYHI